MATFSQTFRHTSRSCAVRRSESCPALPIRLPTYLPLSIRPGKAGPLFHVRMRGPILRYMNEFIPTHTPLRAALCSANVLLSLSLSSLYLSIHLSISPFSQISHSRAPGRLVDSLTTSPPFSSSPRRPPPSFCRFIACSCYLAVRQLYGAGFAVCLAFFVVVVVAVVLFQRMDYALFIVLLFLGQRGERGV